MITVYGVSSSGLNLLIGCLSSVWQQQWASKFPRAYISLVASSTYRLVLQSLAEAKLIAFILTWILSSGYVIENEGRKEGF